MVSGVDRHRFASFPIVSASGEDGRFNAAGVLDFETAIHYGETMAERIMYVQLKTGFNTDRGPAWITRIRFSKSWSTAYFRDLTLRQVAGTFDSNFVDIETGDEYWVSGPKRNRTDGRYSSQQPSIDADVLDDYQAFLAGAPLPGRENG